MKLSRVGEFNFIESIRRRTACGPGVILGIGDDAAWVETRSNSVLITTDLLIEGVHFNLKWTPLFSLGYKALAVNVSDIAAMGGRPLYFLLGLGVPASFETKRLDELYRGMRLLCSTTGVSLVGGDTNVARCLIISIAVVGRARHRPVLRTGARIGDDIYVTGTLGDSALGLKLLRYGAKHLSGTRAAYLIARHRQPTPRVAIGEQLASQRLATAMIDISDGLLQDLGHICAASGIGAELRTVQLPLSPAYRDLLGKHGLTCALSGGEDYELLFCARPGRGARIEKLGRRAGVSITRIGKCIAAAGKHRIRVLDAAGKPLPVSVSGYDHFTSGNRRARSRS